MDDGEDERRSQTCTRGSKTRAAPAIRCVIEHAHVGTAPASCACILDASAFPTRHLAVPNSLGAIVQTRHRLVPAGTTASSYRSC